MSVGEPTAEEIEELLSDEPFGCECDDELPCCSHADQAHILLKLCREYRTAVSAQKAKDTEIAEVITEKQPYRTDSRVACRKIVNAIRAGNSGEKERGPDERG
jgi:hypothetical protein